MKKPDKFLYYWPIYVLPAGIMFTMWILIAGLCFDSCDLAKNRGTNVVPITPLASEVKK